MVLISVVVLGFFSIELFSRTHLLGTDRMTRLQNEISYLLGHMTKNIIGTNVSGGAIGDINQPAVTIATIDGVNALLIWVDSNNNGYRDTDDKQIAYKYRGAPDYQIWFYPDYTDNPASYEVITQKKICPDFSTDPSKPTHINYSPQDNYIDVQVTVCWDPDGSPNACGTLDNPSIKMLTRIKMPSVSTN
jgi:hypothetical protein